MATRETVWQSLQGLSKRQRAVMVLRYYEGYGDEEIAVVLGCRSSTVRSLASRAFTLLRNQPALAKTVEERDLPTSRRFR